MNLSEISVIITTFNEEPNIEVCLDRLDGFGEIVIVDSFSGDGTLDIARRYPAVVYVRPYESAARQKNWALQRVRHRWVLILDADEVMTDELRREIESFDESNGVHGFWIRRGGYINHRRVHCGCSGPDLPAAGRFLVGFAILRNGSR